MRKVDSRSIRYCQNTFHYNGGYEIQISSRYNAYNFIVCERNHQVWVLVFLIRSSRTLTAHFDITLEQFWQNILFFLKSSIFLISTILVTFLAF